MLAWAACVGILRLINRRVVRNTHGSVRGRGATLEQLETLYRDRFEHFARVASAICGDPDIGRDAVQAAFTTAVRQRRTYRGSGSIDAWVWRIVVNEARRLARTYRPERLDDESSQPATGTSKTRPTSASGSLLCLSANGSCSFCATTPTLSIAQSPTSSGSRLARSRRPSVRLTRPFEEDWRQPRDDRRRRAAPFRAT